MSSKDLKKKLLTGDEFEGGSKVIMQNLAARNKEASSKMSEEAYKKKVQGGRRDDDDNNLSCYEKTFSTKCVFYTYGFLDMCIFLALVIYELTMKKGFMIIIIMMIYLPNVLLLILVMIFDNVTTRKYYQNWLRFKLVVQGFLLPIVFLAYDESFFEANICSRELKSFGVDKTEAEIQQIIDRRNFTLLFDVGSSNLHLENLEYPQDQKRTYLTEMKRQFYSTRSYIRNWLSPENVENILTMTDSSPGPKIDVGKKIKDAEGDMQVAASGAPELPLDAHQLELRKIQFCATTVVLTSVLLIVLYQIVSGHQYFVARRWLIEKENSQQMKENMLVRFNTDHENKMQKFAEGDPDFLLSELERAAEALEQQIKRRGESEYTSGSYVAGGTSINS